MSTKSFVSLLFGLAAGAALGVLYAPDKGSNTREKVKRAAAGGAADIKEGLGKVGDEVEDKAAEAKETARETIKDIRETIKEKSAEFKEGARSYLLRKLDRLEAALRKAEEAEAPQAAEPEAETQEPDEQNA